MINFVRKVRYYTLEVKATCSLKELKPAERYLGVEILY